MLGKILFAFVGWILTGGNLLGALLGAWIGHQWDSLRADSAQKTHGQRDHAAGPDDPFAAYASWFGGAREQIAFTVAIVVLAAKLTKVDGAVSRDEINAFKRVFNIHPSQERAVGQLFDQARQDATGYEPYAAQAARVFRQRPAVLEELLIGLTLVAAADGTIQPSEEAYLRHVGQIFGLSDATLARVFAQGSAGGSATASAAQNEDAYRVLGVSPDASNDDIKKAYRRLTREHHPDRLIAEGMPPDFIASANETMKRINAAYDLLSKKRGIV